MIFNKKATVQRVELKSDGSKILDEKYDHTIDFVITVCEDFLFLIVDCPIIE